MVDEIAVWVNGRPLPVPEGAAQRGDGPRVVVRLRRHGAPSAGELAAAGAQVEFWCPPLGACVTLTEPAAAARLGGLPGVAGFVPYAAEHCDRPLPAPSSGPGRRWLDVICFSAADRPRVAAELRKLGAQVLDEAHSKIRIDWPGDDLAIRDVVGVKLVERPRLPHLARSTLAVDIGDADGDGRWGTRWDGSGETIAVADTGLDTGDPGTVHADLAGRVEHLVSWPINPSWAPFVANPGADDGPADVNSGHGTYVAGVVAGDGARSSGRLRGVAPAADLVFQAMEQWVDVLPGHAEIGPAQYALAGRPTDLRDLFLQAREFGARVHVNAWGTPAHGAYDNDCFEVDLFLHEHPDALILAAAGNEGCDRDGNRRADPASLESPAAAKNAITVGATEGSGGIGFFGTWAQIDADPHRFGNPADRSDPVSGDPDRMALLSSAGPTADGRIKPDVCAPGTNVAGLRSSRANGRGWGLVDPAEFYVADGGTSVSVAVAGGFCALLRQAWRRARRGHALAGATLKALAILGCAPVYVRAGPPELEERCVAGFGRLDLAACLPGSGTGGHVRVLANSTVRDVIRNGTVQRFRVDLPNGGRLRAVLCWYDPPGEHLINDLDLALESPHAGEPVVLGNHEPGHPDRPGTPDRTNSVEVVDVDGLAPGPWDLVVTGARVPAAPQPFSLVIRGQDIP